ncbi:MAG: type IX secretion system sortase PorU [Prolixibacteraceae bacterium]|nr:type IX secretion system sortase PorU [Prolixibacteraceae bacterium]MBT6997878.1 type IX secretion system sortase PorU [Prolixibacteraceae bacterium]MBT7394043.1 type IX secretion system sortase PorU [Prolixibacteraceae bacterium]
MKKYIFLLFIIIVGFSVNDVQKDFITLNWEIPANLNSSDKNKIAFTFENAVFPDVNSSIPVFLKTYPLTNPTQDFRVVIDNEVFEELVLDDEISFLNELPDEIKIEKFRLKSGDNQKLEFQVYPIIKRGDKILLLKSFELKQIPIKTKTASVLNYGWKNESVLKSGHWVKISISGNGLYKIPYSLLSEWGFSNPSQVNLFGSGGLSLPENPADIEYDDLNQSAVWHGKNNGIDCLFFYGPGTNSWQPDNSGMYFKHDVNNYSTKGYFFLTEDVGVPKNIELLPEIQETSTHTISTFDAYELYEFEKYNLLHSGKQWFGDKFINGTNKTLEFDLKNLDNLNNVSIRVNAAARSSSTSEMSVSINQSNVGKLSFYKVNTSDPTSLFADEREIRIAGNISGDQLSLSLNYLASNSSSEAWLDFVELNYRKKLINEDEALFFRDITSTGNDNIIEFSIENSSSETVVFDVSDLNNVKEVPLQIIGSIAKGKRPANELREYCAFNLSGSFPEPELVGEIENQDIHSLNTPEFLIITHPNFLSPANALADFHRNYDGMKVEVVQTDKIYNEFSSGGKSATGIRNFIKMFYDRDDILKYVLLLGDGSYDNKNINPGSQVFIPTFQSDNSLNPVASFITDDYFIMLDNNESVYNGAVDLGIGRIPASSTFQAELVVNKILNYYSPEALGTWRNVVCFIGDDEDGNLHMSDSEKLANHINDNHTEFVTDKIYFDAFLQEATPAGERYPDVTDAINKRVKDGVLVLNYVGHANERFMADEHVLDVSNINSWSNSNTLPIFVTATCEFSRFDADDTSAGEYVLFNPSGGGIGLFSTTRVVFAYSNFLLSRSFYNFVFEKDANGDHYRMGDIMRLAKVNTINTTNKRNFSLLADPALKLSYPQNKVTTTTINQKNATGIPDTIGALQKITISGYIADNLGNKLDNFSGKITPTVYDKAIIMETLGNGGQNPMDFKVQENVIYKGLASVTNGDFSFSFVVPKDISYNLGEGKVVYYADNNVVDAHGAFENFVIGGTSGSQISDNQGPQVQLFMDSQDFVPGGNTSKNPTMLALISDENGINTVGTGIGHDITAVLDNDYSNVLVLNNFYQANTDDYTSGTISYPLRDLSIGKHSLILKVWDVANNSTEVEIEFVVSGGFFISEVSNYPNPVNDYTFFTFSHNQSDATLDAIFEIYDQVGRRIDYFTGQIGSNGISSNPVRWDLNETGIQVRNGIYIYKITAQNNDGVIASKSGKMIVAH